MRIFATNQNGYKRFIVFLVICIVALYLFSRIDIKPRKYIINENCVPFVCEIRDEK